MTKEEFWTQKKSLPEYWTVTFNHFQFGTIRLAANQFADIVLGGNTFTACAMNIEPPDESRTSEPTLSVSFPRIVVGREFKQKLKLITTGGRQSPISVTFEKWLGDNLTTPIESHLLYVSDDNGIAFGTDTVQVKAVDDNSVRFDVSRIYTVAEYTGLITA